MYDLDRIYLYACTVWIANIYEVVEIDLNWLDIRKTAL